MGIFLVCLGSRLPQAACHSSGHGEGGDQSFYRSFQLETLMSKKLCANCGQPFTPRPQARTQTYCSDPRCQQARRQDWLEAKLQSDPHYRENKARVQKAWQERNPDYWRKYREGNPEITYKNRDAQRPPIPLPPLLSGFIASAQFHQTLQRQTRGSLRSRPYVQIARAKMTLAKIVLDGDLFG